MKTRKPHYFDQDFHVPATVVACILYFKMRLQGNLS